MGHSFFNPGTFDIALLAPHTGHSRHTQYKQIAGGTNGDPGSLWRDTGEDELAMTVTSLEAAEAGVAAALAAADVRVVSVVPEAVTLERAFLEVTR